MRFIVVRLVALLVAVIGGINVATAVRPRTGLPVDGATPGRAQMLVLGILLLIIARGLTRRRWAAWIGGLVTLGFAIVVVIPQHRFIALIVCGLALIALLSLRTEYVTRPDPARMRVAARLSIVAICLALIGGGWDAFGHRHSLAHGLWVNLSTGSPGDWEAIVLAAALSVALLAAVVLALAPAAAPAPGDAGDRAAIRALVAHGDPDSLAPFATRADKAYVFSPDRRAAIGYRVLLGTALIGGDPIGAAAGARDAMRSYLDLCAARGWRPGVLGASGEAVAVWRTFGLRGLHIGDEAVVRVDEFSLASRRMRNLRQAVSRTRNAGVTVTIGSLTVAHAQTLRPILADWLHGERERGFAMNLDAILTPRADCLIATAYDRAGGPVAFARFAVGADGRVYTLDVAPRGRSAGNGVAERMIVEIIEYARSRGALEVSLNFAAMRWFFDSTDPVSRMAATGLHLLDRWIEIETLNAFCKKFAPTWRARSLVMPTWWQLTWVGAAALIAELSPGAPAPSTSPNPRDSQVDPGVTSRINSKS